jgi:hypothetical protein
MLTGRQRRGRGSWRGREEDNTIMLLFFFGKVMV